MLLEKVWDYHFDPQTNVIEVDISRLRSKIDKGFKRALLLGGPHRDPCSCRGGVPGRATNPTDRGALARGPGLLCRLQHPLLDGSLPARGEADRKG
jgi:hypothetical protein